jgi:phosphoribosylformimino-5-aminoimidazole carboxamide ribotide isomerase
MLALVRTMTRHPVTYSGGIRSLDDLRAVAAGGASGAIVGKALYEGWIDLQAALSSPL